MSTLPLIERQMNFNQFSEKFLKWTEEVIESKKIDGFPICPFARKARLTDKIQFIDARDNIEESLLTFDPKDKEIGIAWLGDLDDVSGVEKITEKIMKEHPNLLCFTSTRSSGAFAKNFTDCVFIQIKSDILEKRKWLKTTDYYNSWPIDYYKLITGEDKS
tara:strand:- start:12951 stop:13433 length:483 start_codon:yes stop_codon:yes gene_type:complete